MCVCRIYLLVYNLYSLSNHDFLQVHAFHAGAEFFVEVDIVLPEETPLKYYLTVFQTYYSSHIC